MRDVIRLFVQIAMLRRGPQDLPASPLLLLLTVCGYVGVFVVVSVLLPPTAGWQWALAVNVMFILGWYAALLRLAGRRERFLQTATGIFGLLTLLTPPLLTAEWLATRFGEDTAWQVPVGVGVLAVLVWYIAAYSHVVKAALEWSSASSVALVILQIVASELLLVALLPSGS